MVFPDYIPSVSPRSRVTMCVPQVKGNNGQPRAVGNQMYAEVKQKYGPDVEVVYEEFKVRPGVCTI